MAAGVDPEQYWQETRPTFAAASCRAFKDDVRLCIVNTLTVYLERTAGLRNSSKLFISVVTPHNAVSKDTISRWLKSAVGRH